MSEQTKLVTLENLHYCYDGTHSVLSIDHFELFQGEKVAVLGPNGAGKSTFFLCLNGVLRAEGRICYRGEEIGKKNLNTLRRNVGIVFQNAEQQIVASTVAADVSFGPMNLALPRQEVSQRVQQALEVMNLTMLRDRPPHYLSGGEKKRVSIAGVLAMEPEVIIFDEPTANLDPANVALLEQTLDMLTQSGKTLMLSTHDVDFAFRWADRVVVIGDGQIVTDGPCGEVLADDAVLKQANLEKPVLLSVIRMLQQSGVLPAGTAVPRTLPELEKTLRKELRK